MKTYIKTFRILLSQWFKAYRRSKQLSQEAMASLLHITARSYIEIERGRSLCATKTLLFFLVALAEEEVLFLHAALKAAVKDAGEEAA